jgi:thiosulfate dehydrogenase [quinone] large subunit
MKLTTIKFTKANYINIQKVILLGLRITVGWHLLYEGMAKLLSSNWTSFAYLSNSKWIFADFFHWIANSPEVLKIVDILNIWGLILIGLALFFGIFTRLASVSGFLLLLLYYLANPPFIGMDYGVPTEGHYLIVNKNLIEMFILLFFVFLPTDMILGIDRLWLIVKAAYQKKKTSPNPYKKVSAKVLAEES